MGPKSEEPCIIVIEAIGASRKKRTANATNIFRCFAEKTAAKETKLNNPIKTTKNRRKEMIARQGAGPISFELNSGNIALVLATIMAAIVIAINKCLIEN